MHFKIIKYKESNIPCSICHKETAPYEVEFYYEANGRYIRLGSFCEKHFQEFLEEVQTVKL